MEKRPGSGRRESASITNRLAFIKAGKKLIITDKSAIKAACNRYKIAVHINQYCDKQGMQRVDNQGFKLWTVELVK